MCLQKSQNVISTQTSTHVMVSKHRDQTTHNGLSAVGYVCVWRIASQLHPTRSQVSSLCRDSHTYMRTRGKVAVLKHARTSESTHSGFYTHRDQKGPNVEGAYHLQ
jgi:hypothetical protein